MDEKLGLAIETSVDELLLGPLECLILGDVEMNNLPTRNLPDDEDIEDTKAHGILHEEVT